MTTPPEIVAMLNWQRKHAGELAYSQTDRHRLASDTEHLSSPTDCSGLAIRLFRHFGGAAAVKELEGATYTGNLCRLGELVTTSKGRTAAGDGLLPGDLVFFTWSGHNPTWDHVAMYAGDGRIWNHGGPGRGPNNWSLRDNVGYASEVMARRYSTSRTTATSDQVRPAPAPSDPLEEVMAMYANKAEFEAAMRAAFRTEANKGVHVNGLLGSDGKRYTVENFLHGLPNYADMKARAAAALKKAGRK